MIDSGAIPPAMEWKAICLRDAVCEIGTIENRANFLALWEASVVKVPVDDKPLLQQAKELMTDAKKWTQERVVAPFTGQAVHDEVRAYMADNEKINTALVTRVIEVETKNTMLESRLSKLESQVKSFRTWCVILLVAGLAVASIVKWWSR